MIARGKQRRALVLAVLLGLLLPPHGEGAQQPGKVPRIGVVLAGSAPNPFADALRRGLAEHGWVEGRNILVDYRYAEGQSARYPSFVAELIGLKVDLLVAGGGSVQVAKQATSTIPIVFPAITDPVAAGLVASLARPGGNVTGQAQLDTEITAKRMQLLRELVPGMERLAVLRGIFSPQAKIQGDVMEAAALSAARSIGLRPQVISVSHMEELSGVLNSAREAGAEALMVLASAYFTADRQRVVDLAAENRLVAIYEHRDFADAGGLVSYGPNIAEMYRSTARYVDKILKGAKPDDLPIEQPTTFELVINLKTAKVLGLKIPPSILLRADRVIE